jgi:GNAT superfamily N-acetyltransferase
MPDAQSALELTIRYAREADLDDIAEMVDDFVTGHPAKHHPRSRSKLRDAYFGDAPVARLVVATYHGRVIGMAQWALIYDMFWSAFGGNVEWLYVRPAHRGRGVVAAIVAEICAQVRNAGGEFLHGGGNKEAERLYERVAMGWQAHECYVSAEAFQALADLAGLAPRDIVRRLPDPSLNKVAARARG